MNTHELQQEIQIRHDIAQKRIDQTPPNTPAHAYQQGYTRALHEILTLFQDHKTE